MSYFRMQRPRGLMLAGLIVALIAVPTRAADPESLDTSLKLVPAEAAFYTATLRNRDQYDAVVKSKAIAKLKALPFVQKAWKEGLAELSKPGGALEVLDNFRKDPENQALLDLFGDMVSNETFVYGDESLNQMLELYLKLTRANQYGTMMAALKPENRGKDPTELQIKVMLKTITENMDQIKIPDVVIGFRLSDTDRAEAQIKRLEGLIKGPIAQNPQTKGRLKRVSLGGKDFLTFTLDGSLIPFEELDKKLENLEDAEKAQAEKLKKKLQSMTLTISMGVRDKYMLLSIGSGTKHIIKMGKGKSLATRPEFQPLAKHTDKPLAELGYVSKELRSKFAMTKKDVDMYLEVGREALKNAEQLPEPLRKRLEKDIEELAKDVKKGIPEVGPLASFGYLTSTGMESLTYDWSEHPDRRLSR